MPLVTLQKQRCANFMLPTRKSDCIGPKISLDSLSHLASTAIDNDTTVMSIYVQSYQEHGDPKQVNYHLLISFRLSLGSGRHTISTQPR